MGCTQTSTTIRPQHQIPIERIVDYNNYRSLPSSPLNVSPLQNSNGQTRSSLKKNDRQWSADRAKYSDRRLVQAQKSVNFHQQVQVKPRTPTPKKIWYEKPTSTMPVSNPNDPLDDDDYEDEDIYDNYQQDFNNSNSEYNDDSLTRDTNQTDYSIGAPIDRESTPYISTSQIYSPWPNRYPNRTRFSLNNNPVYRSVPVFSLNRQSRFIQPNSVAPENSNSGRGNKIKVRRRLASIDIIHVPQPASIAPPTTNYHLHRRPSSSIPIQLSSTQHLNNVLQTSPKMFRINRPQIPIAFSTFEQYGQPQSNPALAMQISQPSTISNPIESVS